MDKLDKKLYDKLVEERSALLDSYINAMGYSVETRHLELQVASLTQQINTLKERK